MPKRLDCARRSLQAVSGLLTARQLCGPLGGVAYLRCSRRTAIERRSARMSVSIGRQSRLARRGVDALAHVHLDGRVILVGVFLARESMDSPGALLIAVVDDPGFLFLALRVFPNALAN